MSGDTRGGIETVGSPATTRIYAYTVVRQGRRAVGAHVGGTHDRPARSDQGRRDDQGNRARRIKQQLGTAYPGLDGVDILLDEPAKRDGRHVFRDHDVHRALRSRRDPASRRRVVRGHARRGEGSHRRRAHGTPSTRPHQGLRDAPRAGDAVALTAGYFGEHADDSNKPPKFLWNAKMRFGKTFTTYQLAREMGWKRVLVLTYKPAVQTAWRDDLLSHVDFEGWQFVDRDTSLRRRRRWPMPSTRWSGSRRSRTSTARPQTVVKEHNETIHLIDWDCIVLDEYHFGAWRDAARDLYDPTDKELAEEEEPEDRSPRTTSG